MSWSLIWISTFIKPIKDIRSRSTSTLLQTFISTSSRSGQSRMQFICTILTNRVSNSISTITMIINISTIDDIWITSMNESNLKIITTFVLVVTESIFSLNIKVSIFSSNRFNQVIHCFSRRRFNLRHGWYSRAWFNS